MAFTVRVQLVDVDEGDDAYETLHTKMAESGFKRTIRDSEGILYNLPFGTYNYSAEATRDDVLKKAKDAAIAAKKSPPPRILVTESSGRRWSGLDQVQPKK